MKKSEMQREIEKLQAEKAALQKANAERNAQIKQLNMEKWSKLIPLAAAKCHEFLDKHIKGLYQNVTFEHVDAAGFWFNYEMNDGTRQTCAMRHEEVE